MPRHTMRRRKFIALAGTGATLLAGTGPATARGHPNRNFRAHLSALPDVDTDAQGQATFQLGSNGGEMGYRLVVANIEDVLMAHIHLRPTGGVAVWLYPEGPPPELIPGRFDGVLAEGTITDEDVDGPDGVDTLAGLVEELRAGNGFVRVHTGEQPVGEIEGDVH